MVEPKERHLVDNLLKASEIQGRRIRVVEESSSRFGLLKRLMWWRSSIHGGVQFDRPGRLGGIIQTEIVSGRAKLHQTWRFMSDGSLTSARVERQLKNSRGDSYQNVGVTEVLRDINDKMTIVDEHRTPLWSEWAKAFRPAKVKLAKRHELSTSLPAEK